MNKLVDTVASQVTVQRTFALSLKLLTVFGVLSLVIVLYALFFEGPFIRYQNLPFPVQEPVEQGRAAAIIIERCNDSKNQRVYTASRTLKNIETGKEVSLPEATVTLKPGCERTINKSVIIPLDTPPGKYVITGDAITQGLIKKHEIPWYTEQFDVVPIKPITEQLRSENAADQSKQKGP